MSKKDEWITSECRSKNKRTIDVKHDWKFVDKPIIDIEGLFKDIGLTTIFPVCYGHEYPGETKYRETYLATIRKRLKKEDDKYNEEQRKDHRRCTGMDPPDGYQQTTHLSTTIKDLHAHRDPAKEPLIVFRGPFETVSRLFEELENLTRAEDFKPVEPPCKIHSSSELFYPPFNGISTDPYWEFVHKGPAWHDRVYGNCEEFCSVPIENEHDWAVRLIRPKEIIKAWGLLRKALKNVKNGTVSPPPFSKYSHDVGFEIPEKDMEMVEESCEGMQEEERLSALAGYAFEHNRLLEWVHMR